MQLQKDLKKNRWKNKLINIAVKDNGEKIFFSRIVNGVEGNGGRIDELEGEEKAGERGAGLR